jgi:inorganic pyrophosphatase
LSTVFHVEYGFVPQTLAEDGDPLDVMALSYEPLHVGTVAKVKVFGMLMMKDERGIDNNIFSIL